MKIIIRLDVLIGALQALQSPRPIAINKSIVFENGLLVQDSKRNPSESVFYNLSTWECKFCTTAWQDYIVELKNKGPLYEETIKEFPSLMKIPHHMWFKREEDKILKQLLLPPF